MGLFTKIFGGKGASKESQSLVKDVIDGIIERTGIDISYDIKSTKENDNQGIKIEFYGDDEKLFTNKDGALLDAFQLFVKRALQHQLPEDTNQIICDCNDYREKANQSLVELAEKLKNRAIDQGKSVYLRALPPKDRKVIHQFLASDERVRSRSVGDGLYKKIKIYPNKKDGEISSVTR